MTTLDQLEALAKEATHGDWYFAGCNTVEVNHPVHGPCEIAHPCIIDGTAQFIAAANPATILTLIALVRQQHEALKESAAQVKELITVFHVPSPEASFDRYKEAIAAFESFVKE